MTPIERKVVQVSAHDPAWQGRFKREAKRIREALGDRVVAIEHVGSTAVRGLDAKPTIDILVGVRSLEAGEDAKQAMENLGYIYRGAAGLAERVFFRKGPAFPREFNAHFVVLGGMHWRQMLAFRDYLRQHHEAAREYAALKLRLVSSEQGRGLEGYALGKEAFIGDVLQKAGMEGRPLRQEW